MYIYKFIAYFKCLITSIFPFNKLGGKMHVFCGSVLYGKLAGVTVGYTITSSVSLVYVVLFYYYIHKLINHLCC